MTEFIKCACGKLYRIYDMYASDQSVCPKCKADARKEFESQEKDDA